MAGSCIKRKKKNTDDFLLILESRINFNKSPIWYPLFNIRVW